MSHSDAAHSSPANPFSADELAALHADDRSAAKHIVLLMLSIFIVGVILYSVVDYSIMN